MDQILVVVADWPVTLREALVAGAVLAALALLLMALAGLAGARRRAGEAAAAAERQRELDDKMAEVARLQAELGGRMQTLAEVFGSRQADLARAVSDRLEQVRTSMQASLGESAQRASEQLGKLNERLAVIDAAQANLTGLTGEVMSLKEVLANKPARGAYGQGRMEAIVRDALPAKAYRFQATLSNRSRPDCLIDLPGDERPLAVDAKFPLEGFVAFREAATPEARLVAERRVRGDLQAHIRDVAEKYLLPGETQEIALLFVPSEAIYADLAEHFEEIVQKAHRARVLIVSPSLLMMAVQVAQAIVRDAAVREQARLIQTELGRLLDDVRRLSERAEKLDQHFRLVQEDIGGIRTSAGKIEKRGRSLETLDFAPETRPVAGELPPAA